MRYRIFLVLFCSVIVVLLLGQVAYAQPYVDTGFTERTTAGEADLVVVRENYDNSSHQQAIYFRMAPTTSGFDIGGTITFPAGVTIVEVYYLKAESQPASSDPDWAIAGGNYSGSDRGLEDSEDILGWLANTVWFDCHFGSPVDDFRVIIDYGDEFPEGATFDIELLTGAKGSGQYSVGIQVGNTDGIPGSGDFGEIAQLTVPLTPGEPQPTLEQRVEELESQLDALKQRLSECPTTKHCVSEE